MKLKLITLSLFACVLLLFSTCSKDSENEYTFDEAISHEALSDEQVDFLDNQESVETSTDEILLPNGLTIDEFMYSKGAEIDDSGNRKSDLPYFENPVDFVNMLIGEMCVTALYLTKRSNFRYQGDGGMNPTQTGLAYSYGSRDHTIRKKPEKGQCKDYEVYGLDCSGFIYQLFLQSGVDLTTNTWADKQRQPAELRNHIIKAFKYDAVKKIKIADLGKKDISEFKTGDIIYWLETNENGVKWANHIGMVILDRSGKLMIAQSNGSPSQNCEKNWSRKRGPNLFNLAPSVSIAGGLGDDYGIVRISADPPVVPDVNRAFVTMDLHASYHETAPTYVRDREGNTTIEADSYYPGSLTGFTFNASYSRVYLHMKHTGTIEVVFNGNYERILKLKWTEKFEAGPSGPSDGFTQEIFLEAKDIPKEVSDRWTYSVIGEKTCEHILKLEHKQISSTGLNYTLTDHECNSASEIRVSLKKE